jgi:hypothetical protein
MSVVVHLLSVVVHLLSVVVHLLSVWVHLLSVVVNLLSVAIVVHLLTVRVDEHYWALHGSEFTERAEKLFLNIDWALQCIYWAFQKNNLSFYWAFSEHSALLSILHNWAFSVHYWTAELIFYSYCNYLFTNCHFSFPRLLKVKHNSIHIFIHFGRSTNRKVTDHWIAVEWSQRPPCVWGSFQTKIPESGLLLKEFCLFTNTLFI